MYPAFAVATALQSLDSAVPPDLIFIGGAGGKDQAMLERSGIHWLYTAMIPGGPVRGVNPFRAANSLLQLAAGAWQAGHILRRYRPQSVFLTGGWASLSVGLAAWLTRVPIVTFVPDIEPGSTLRVVSRWARKVAATTEATEEYIPANKLVVTGYPLRQQVLQATREEALSHFDLDPARPTLLVTGGSLGARSLNRALLPLLPQLVADGWQIIHLTGTLDWPQVEAASASLTSDARLYYHPFAYLHDDMGLALAAADLVVSRAGGTSLGELPYFGLPAILVPYPHAWRYQKVNADYLVAHGAAVRLDDEDLAAALYPAIQRLHADPQALSQMAQRARALARPDGARNIARLLLELELP